MLSMLLGGSKIESAKVELDSKPKQIHVRRLDSPRYNFS
jgi:hypothetical protein